MIVYLLQSARKTYKFGSSAYEAIDFAARWGADRWRAWLSPGRRAVQCPGAPTPLLAYLALTLFAYLALRRSAFESPHGVELRSQHSIRLSVDALSAMGRWIYRRPLNADEVNKLSMLAVRMAVPTDPTSGRQGILQAMLQSPFSYFAWPSASGSDGVDDRAVERV
jgi:hypothetical protein